jgi:hypothetical protein
VLDFGVDRRWSAAAAFLGVEAFTAACCSPAMFRLNVNIPVARQ